MAPPKTIPPPPERAVPRFLPKTAWRTFFIAARTMVGRHQRGGRTSLIELWDKAASQLSRGLRRAGSETAVDYPTAIAFGKLIAILEGWVTPQPNLWQRDIVSLYERTLKVLEHCKLIRRNCGRMAVYIPFEAKWARTPVHVPRTPMPTDSAQFYRVALSQVFSREEIGRIQNHVLETLPALDRRPAEAARTVLASVFERKLEYLAQKISAARRPRPTPIIALRRLGTTSRRPQ